MSLPEDLLEQAKHLAAREPRRPKQASLRRAVSSGYYALFHLLTGAAGRYFIRGDEPARAAQRAILQRMFRHERMKRVCASWWGPRQHGRVVAEWRDAVGADTVSADLQLVAGVFVEAQEARHSADYDIGRAFSRQDVQDLLGDLEDAFEAWKRLATTFEPETGAFLLALLVQ